VLGKQKKKHWKMRKKIIEFDGKKFVVPKGVGRDKASKLWHVKRHRLGKTTTAKCFSDKKYGSTEAALEAAIKHNEIVARTRQDHLVTLKVADRKPNLGFRINKSRDGKPRVYIICRFTYVFGASNRSFTLGCGFLHDFEVARLRLNYQKVYAASEHQKRLSIERNERVAINKEELDFDELMKKYPVQTGFLTRKYMQELYEEKQTKKGKSNEKSKN